MRPVLAEASLLDALEQAVVVTDLSATIVYWNAAAEQLYGWRREEAVGRTVFDVTPTAASRRQGEEIFEAVRLGRRWTGDYPVQRSDSGTFLAHVTLTPVYDEQGRYVAVLGLSRDVTEERLRTAQVDDSADRLQLAVAAGHLGTWTWTRASGRMHWDDAAKQIFGVATGGFNGTLDGWLDLVHPQDRHDVLERLDELVTGAESYQTFEYRILPPDGRVRWVEGRARVLRDEDGKVIGSVGYVHALSEPEAALR